MVGRESDSGNPPVEQKIQYCRAADGVRIAYAKVGDGPPLLKTANWLNHLELDWDGPVWGQLFRCLSSKHTLVRYDERGNGLSDWNAEALSLEAYVQDMEAVVDAASADRFSDLPCPSPRAAWPSRSSTRPGIRSGSAA